MVFFFIKIAFCPNEDYKSTDYSLNISIWNQKEGRIREKGWWRGRPNEARNVAIYLLRQLRGSELKGIGTEFGISSYSTLSTII